MAMKHEKGTPEFDKIKQEFADLIANTPEWHPPEPPSEIIKPGEPSEWVELPNDNLDVVADAFGEWSRDKCGVIHRFNSTDGWTIYVKDRYQRVEDEDEIKGYIQQFICKFVKIKKRTKQEDGSFKVYFVRPTNKMMVSSYITNVFKTFKRPNASVHLLPSQKAPCSLDGELDSNVVIAMKNGLLDRSTKPRTLHPHTPEYYNLNYMDYDYDPTAISEIWGRFLVDITDSDPDLMTLLQQWCGYLLMKTNKFQKFLLCVGDGANGKGVFFDTITAALGHLNVSNVPLACFEDTAKIFSTYGKMVNMSSENSKHMEEAAESIIKEYVGGDKMVWRQLYANAFSDYPTAKLMFACNELPIIRDITDGIWRRMLYVPFDAKFEGGKINTDLAKQLQQPKELAGILNWMLEGIESLETMGGFCPVQRCIDGLATYKKESNPTQLFMDDSLVEGDFDDYIISSDVYGLYRNWCQTNGCYPKNAAHFGRAIKKTFTRSEKARQTIDGKKVYIYRGVKMVGEFDFGSSGPSKDHLNDEVTGSDELPF
jgi:P4 family phage/plasmid primase-like protien